MTMNLEAEKSNFGIRESGHRRHISLRVGKAESII